jgi:uncharacterized GH25 family protein
MLYYMSTCVSFFLKRNLNKIHRSLTAQLSVYMEGFHLKFVPLTQYEPFHVRKKFLTKVLSAVCSLLHFTLRTTIHFPN